ncbi:MAG TPA: hypothetical protein VFT99_14710, partial [Roseiflexaceae bacterium]|nr:hypothetical protein [Roseiflexaceae bacterium]
VDNPFHLSKFTIASFFELLRTHFPYVLGLYQNYTVGSMIWSTSHAQEDRTPDSTARRIDIDSYILGDEHEDTQHADCFMALCSRQPIAAPRQIVLQAGWVWRSHNAELAQLIDTLWNDGQRLSRSWEAHTATIQEQLTYISKLEQERDQLQRDNSQLSQETQRLAESWDSHTAHIQALQQRLVEIEQHRDQIWQDGQRLSESWQEQARLIEDLRRQLGEATLQIEDLRSQLDEAELQIAQLNGILEHNRHLIEARSWVDGRVSGVRRRMRLVGRNTRRKQGR